MNVFVVPLIFLAVCSFCRAGDPVHAEYEVRLKGIYGYNTTQVTVDVDKDKQIVTAVVDQTAERRYFGGGYSYFDVKNNFAILENSKKSWCQLNIPDTKPVSIESTESLLKPPVFKEYDEYNATKYEEKLDQTNQDGVLPIVYCVANKTSGTELSQEILDGASKHCEGGKITHILTNCYRRGGLRFQGWYCVSAGVMATPQGLQLACVTHTGNFGK